MDKKFNKIDQIARDAFDDFEIDFNPDDWKLMEEKLDKKEHLMPYIWLYKGLEASLLLLILFTGVHFLYQNSNSGNHQSDSKKSSQEVYADHQHREDTHSSTDKSLANLDEKLSKQESFSNENTTVGKPDLNGDNEATFGTKNRFTGKTVKAENVGVNNTTQNLNQGKPFENTTSAVLAQEETNEIFNAEEFKENTSASSAQNGTSQISSNELANNKVNKISFKELAVIDLTKALADNHGGDDNDVVSINSKYRYPKIYSPRMHLAIFVGADYNVANSEGIPQLGMTFGVQLESEINKRFSLSYGIIASRKNFEDYYKHEIDRTATEGVIYTQTVERQAALSTLQIPLFANMMLYQNAKWELNASIGISAHLLATRYVQGTTRTAVQQAAGTLINVSEINSDAQEKGAFQGGDFNRNIFATAGVGISLERQLSQDFKLFLNPQYQHALNSIGDNQDRLSGFTLLVGLKKAL